MQQPMARMFKLIRSQAETGELFMWGSNTFGELGTGDNQSRSDPTHVAALEGKHVLSVALSGTHTMALIWH